MENASKALIIAGAILLSIVLITLGVLIIGRGQDAIEQTNIDDQVVSTWNQKWTKYEGKDISGTAVNNMINEVISSNRVVTANGETEKVIKITKTGKENSVPNNKIITSGTLKYQDSTNDEVSVAPGRTNGGTEECTKYANPNGKYDVTAFRNKSGYIWKLEVKF